MRRQHHGSKRSAGPIHVLHGRIVATACALAVAATGLWRPASYAGTGAQTFDASGIELVDQVVQARPTTWDQSTAFDVAMNLAAVYPDDMGYPWIDPATGAIELSATTDLGREILSGSIDEIQVPHSVRDVAYSYGQLEWIKDDVTTLTSSGVTDSDLIYESAPDHERGRIVLTVSKLSQPLLAELAKRYGTEAIAIRVDPDHKMAGTATRQDDYSPFWGGARIDVPAGGCTDAFSWYIDSTHDAMLTAGHCAPSGGTVSTPHPQSMGTVASGSEENWSTSTGTTKFPGETANRGDMAFVRLYTTRDSAPYIYRGWSNSGSSDPVKSMWSRSPAVGDQFYTAEWSPASWGLGQ